MSNTGTGTMIAPAGLKGLVVADTAIGDVRGQEGYFHYREFSAATLAASQSFETVWKLVLDGELVNDIEPFAREVGALRKVPADLWTIARAMAPRVSDPVSGMRSLLPLLASFRPTIDESPDERRADALRVAAAVPTLIAGLHRLAAGLSPIAPDPNLGHVADYLRMITGSMPSADAVRALETYLVATIDHGFNASTFTARVITSTGADVVSAVVGASGALSGPLHGGAPGRALDMIERIGDPENTEAWLRASLARGEKVMGFGHAVYKTEDPRSVLLQGVAQRLGGDLVERAAAIEPRILAVLRDHRPGQSIQTNVEYYAAVVMEQIGLPRSLFTPTFTVSRVVGWTAHILEQAANNKIMRPSAHYIGPPPLA
jgi:citrate synthase